jgi:DNA-binding transcriptional ArsR family regulator
MFAPLSVLLKIQALSNETRLEIVELVRTREMAAGDIARRFKMTRSAVSQHLGLLRGAGLLEERRAGSQRLYVVREEGFSELAEFIGRYWRRRLQRLKLAAEAAERSRAGSRKTRK